MKLSEADRRLVRESLEHIRKTNAPSINEETGDCCYSGIGCAFSVAIQPLYVKSLDDYDCYEVLDRFKGALKPWARHCTADIASMVQAAHDIASAAERNANVSFYEKYKSNLKYYFSDPYSLDFAEIVKEVEK